MEAEIEMPLPINLPFPMPKVKGMVTPQQRAIISVAAAALAGFQALLDIADRDGHATTIGVVAGLLAGGWGEGQGLGCAIDLGRGLLLRWRWQGMLARQLGCGLWNSISLVVAMNSVCGLAACMWAAGGGG